LTRAVRLGRHGPLALHLLSGILVVALTLRIPCGADECMGPLAAATAACVWVTALPFVIVASRSPRRDVRVLSWFIPLLCVPLTWASVPALYLMFPELAST
jgi:hypothetical protein